MSSLLTSAFKTIKSLLAATLNLSTTSGYQQLNLSVEYIKI